MWQDELKKAIAIAEALRTVKQDAKKRIKDSKKSNTIEYDKLFVDFHAWLMTYRIENNGAPDQLDLLYSQRQIAGQTRADKILRCGMELNCSIRIAAGMIFGAKISERELTRYFNDGLYHQNPARLCCALLMGANPATMELEGENALRWADRRIEYRPMSSLLRGWLQHRSRVPMRVAATNKHLGRKR